MLIIALNWPLAAAQRLKLRPLKLLLPNFARNLLSWRIRTRTNLSFLLLILFLNKSVQLECWINKWQIMSGIQLLHKVGRPLFPIVKNYFYVLKCEGGEIMSESVKRLRIRSVEREKTSQKQQQNNFQLAIFNNNKKSLNFWVQRVA